MYWDERNVVREHSLPGEGRTHLYQASSGKALSRGEVTSEVSLEVTVHEVVKRADTTGGRRCTRRQSAENSMSFGEVQRSVE